MGSSRMKLIGGISALAILAVAGTPRPGSGQVALGADLGLLSSYVWRGVTYTNRFVVQPDAWIATVIEGMNISTGVWANIEPGQYDDDTDISQGGGQAGPDLTEWNWWLEAGTALGSHEVAGGVTGYRFPNDAGLTSASNTAEIYARAQFDLPLRPWLGVFYDVDRYHGVYAELAISHLVPLSPQLQLDLGALAGVSSGFERFRGDGLTHFDISAATTFHTAGLALRPVVHLQFGVDDFTTITENGVCGVVGSCAPQKTSDTKLWFGVRASWYRPFGG